MHSLRNVPLKFNNEKKRFELEVENHIAFSDFILNNQNIMFITHTEVPRELEGKGVGSELIFKVLTWIKEQGYTLAPLCPFTAAYVKKHPEWAGILAPGFHV